MKRSLKEYALAAEIIGAVAVVISLIYVGVSVNQNTLTIRVANHQALVAMDQDKNGWFRDPAFAAIYETGNDDPGELTPGQALQYRTFLADTFNIWEFAFITHTDEMMDDNIWDGFDGFYRSTFRQKGTQFFWREGRSTFSPPFRKYVDSVLLDIDQATAGRDRPAN